MNARLTGVTARQAGVRVALAVPPTEIENHPMPNYAWKDNRHAILGTVYLYFAYGCHEKEIPSSVISTFIDAHQDAEGSLTESKVRAAVQAVRNLDTGEGMYGPSQDLRQIWEALLPLRPTFPS